jgi:hypothetical protein
MTSFSATTKTSDRQATESAASTQQSRPSVPQATLGNCTTPLLEKFYRGLTAPLRCLPDFLIIGTQRGGTTSLYHYLQTHSSFMAPTTKELHFLDRNYHKGPLWYRAHFPTVWEKAYAQQMQRRAVVTGEASPYYLFHPHVYQRLAQIIPHAKLIVLLRNPVDRAYSHYYQSIELGYESRSGPCQTEEDGAKRSKRVGRNLAIDHFKQL